jgi:hypothetical protein
MSSSGEMKMSLRLITFMQSACVLRGNCVSLYILVTEMLEKLQFSIGTLGKDWSAERLHDLLDCHRLPSKLVFG